MIRRDTVFFYPVEGRRLLLIIVVYSQAYGCGPRISVSSQQSCMFLGCVPMLFVVLSFLDGVFCGVLFNDQRVLIKRYQM